MMRPTLSLARLAPRRLHTTTPQLFKQRKADPNTKPNPDPGNPDAARPGTPGTAADDAIPSKSGAGAPHLYSEEASEMASVGAREREAKSFVDAEKNVTDGKK